MLVSVSFVFAFLLTTVSVVQQGNGEEKFINRNEWKLNLLVSISFVFALLLTTVFIVQQGTSEEKFINKNEKKLKVVGKHFICLCSSAYHCFCCTTRNRGREVH